MSLGWRKMLLSSAKTFTVCLLCTALAGAQAQGGGEGQIAATAEKPQMAEDVLKNVQVLRGISMDEFIGTMGFFASALSLNCIEPRSGSGHGLGQVCG